MHLVDSLGRREDIKYICCLHEQAAAIAAEAYGQYTNHLGVALVTTGPGSTNAITGVAGAWIDSTPLLVLSGQVKRQDMLQNIGVRQMGIQEVDITSLVKPITKYAITVLEPEMIKYHLQEALFLAKTGRKGPVWIDIPLDVQGSVIEENDLEDFNAYVDQTDTKDLKFKDQKTLELLAQAARPVILLGNGVRLAGAKNIFYQLIYRLKIPVLATWKATDMIPENHPLYCGKPGAVGQRGANFTQQNSDWIMMLGARLDLCQVAHNYPNFARAAKKIIVDIDGAEIKKLKTFGMNIDIEVNADVACFLRELLALLKEETLEDYREWLALNNFSWSKPHSSLRKPPRRSTVHHYLPSRVRTTPSPTDSYAIYCDCGEGWASSMGFSLSGRKHTVRLAIRMLRQSWYSPEEWACLFYTGRIEVFWTFAINCQRLQRIS